MQCSKQPLAAVIALILAAPALAQQPEPELPEVKVLAPAEQDRGYVAPRSQTGTKTDTPLIETPQSISVITADRLEDQGVDQLSEALRYTPGVQGETFGFNPRGAPSLQIRGFDATRTGLYRDGLQLRTATGRSETFNPEPYGAARIEVLRGPASVLYGQSSPGGIVNIVSKRPSAKPIREVALETGSFDRLEGRFDLGGPLDKDGTVLFRLTGLGRDSEAQVDFIKDDRRFIAPALTWRPGKDTTLTLLTHYSEEDTGDFQWMPASGTLLPNPNGKIPRNRNAGEPGFDHHVRSEHAFGWLLEHRASDALILRQNARYGESVVDRAVVFGTALQADQRTLNRSAFENDKNVRVWTIDNQAQLEFSTGALHHTLLAGLDYQRLDEHNLSTFGAAPSLDIFNPVYGAPVPRPPVFQDEDTVLKQVGLYLQDQIRFDRKWVLSLGGRHDWAETLTVNRRTSTRTEQNDSKFTGRAGLVYLADSGLAPYASYSTSFLPVAGTDGAGNLLRPETGEQYEAGIKYQPPGSNSFVTLAAFDLTRQNVLESVPAPLLRRQTGEVRSRGIELEGVASLDSGLDLIAGYTWLDAEITASARPGEQGERPTQTPEHMASLWANYSIRGGAMQGWGFGAGARYLGSTFGNIPNTVKVPGVTLFDAGVHYDRTKLRFALNAHNLFDKEYVASAFNNGRNTSFGLARTVKASVSYRW